MKKMFVLTIAMLCAIQMHGVIFTIDGITYDNYSSTVYEGKFLNVKVIEIDRNYEGAIVIPSILTAPVDNVYFRVTEIGHLYPVPGMTSITISRTVTTIDDNPFTACVNLASITVDEENPVYSSIDGLLCDKEKTKLLCYPIGMGTSFSIPNWVKSIGNSAFENTGLTSISIPNSVTSIGMGAFHECINLVSINISDSVQYIEPITFKGCTNLSSVSIPNSVTSIGRWAFQECTGLTSVSIPNSVNHIEEGVFYSCTNLNYIIVSWSNPVSVVYENTESFPIFGDVDVTKVKLYVPVGTKAAYQSIETWKDFNIVEGTGSTTITNIENYFLQVSPNPATDFITISGLQINETIRLFDLNGRLLISRRATSESETISVSHLPAGWYLVRVGSGQTVKLVKK
jgi:hypothetical protein